MMIKNLQTENGFKYGNWLVLYEIKISDCSYVWNVCLLLIPVHDLNNELCHSRF